MFADVEVAGASVFGAGQSGVFGEYCGGTLVVEGRGEAHPLSDLRHLPPIGTRVAGYGEKRALARDAPLGVGDGAALLAPGGGRQQHVGVFRRICVARHVGDDDERAGRERRCDVIGIRHAVDGVRRHDPDGLDPAVGDGAEHIDGLEPGRACDPRRVPERLNDAPMLGVAKFHVRGQHVRETAGFAAPHGIGLASHRERTHAGFADTACGEVAIDDRVDLVGAGDRLIDALTVDGDGALGRGKKVVEGDERPAVEPRDGRDFIERGCAGGFERGGEIPGVFIDVGGLKGSRAVEMCEKAVEQRDVRAGSDGKMKIRDLARRCPARIDDDDLRSALFPRRRKALEQHGMAPREVGPDQHDEIGQLEIFIRAGHRVRAEGAFVAGHRRRHAQARVGIDICRADESFHQLVGDVVVLGQDLTGDIERNGVGPVLSESLSKARRHEVERCVPARTLAMNHRVEHPVL